MLAEQDKAWGMESKSSRAGWGDRHARQPGVEGLTVHHVWGKKVSVVLKELTLVTDKVGR